MLNPTPADRLTDAEGRPYFLWDEEATTLTTFLVDLRGADIDVRVHSLGKLMRQAKPDDVFTFVTPHVSWPFTSRTARRAISTSSCAMCGPSIR